MKSLKNLFEPKQFEHLKEVFFKDDLWDECAIVAQKILDQFIEEKGVKVLGSKVNGGWCFDEPRIMNNKGTHTAILIDIQPLKQCEHKEAIYYEAADKTWFKCRDCGKPVKAKGWDLA